MTLNAKSYIIYNSLGIQEDRHDDPQAFLKTSGAVALGAAAAACDQNENPQQEAVKEEVAKVTVGDSAKMLLNRPEHPAPSTADRLPLEWHQGRVRILQEKLAERGLDGILITDRWNLIYYTGLWH